MTTARLIASLWLAACLGCAGDKKIDGGEPPSLVVIKQVGPATVLPLTTVVVLGSNLTAQATHTLQLLGSMRLQGGTENRVDLAVPLSVRDTHAEWVVDPTTFARLGEGQFFGSVAVVSRNDWGEVVGPAISISLRLMRYLTPTLSSVGSGLVFLNTPIALLGDGFLLGGGEGKTVAELKGCFLPATTSGTCAAQGKPIQTLAVVTPQKASDRRGGAFLFAPSIAGIMPGRFEGTVTLVNQHADAKQQRSSAQAASFDLQRSRLLGFDQSAVSLGQYLDLRGDGFVGGEDSSTVVHFDGSFTPQKGTSRPVTFDIVTAYREGNRVQVVIDEGDGVGLHVKLRSEVGTLAGRFTPTIRHGAATLEGDGVTINLAIAPVKQVCWVRFTEGWVESLRDFGLQAAEARIRQRALDVLRRDYLGINVEFRDTEPMDYKLYARLEIGGKDPNGQGLLGYDNTPGKDVDNKRLHDRIGGVNALTQQDGFPGYGGVFVESMLGFSEKPPAGISRSPLHTPLFDTLFDPFRPDRGRELTTTEVVLAPQLTSTAGCPASDRVQQASCAIHVLGNLIGSTASHEFGHSLGLADPYGAATAYHNPGDVPNRLMEAGGDRPFEERAELNGQGPAVFCVDEFSYMKKLLPTSTPDPVKQRPSCD